MVAGRLSVPLPTPSPSYTTNNSCDLTVCADILFPCVAGERLELGLLSASALSVQWVEIGPRPRICCRRRGYGKLRHPALDAAGQRNTDMFPEQVTKQEQNATVHGCSREPTSNRRLRIITTHRQFSVNSPPNARLMLS